MLASTVLAVLLASESLPHTLIVSRATKFSSHYDVAGGGGVQTGRTSNTTCEHPIPTVGPRNKSLNPLVSGQSCRIVAPALVHANTPPSTLQTSAASALEPANSGSSKWRARTPVSLLSRTARKPDSKPTRNPGDCVSQRTPAPLGSVRPLKAKRSMRMPMSS